MTTYFVSAGGNDSANGTSSGTPWLTVAKVNSFTFAAGDIIQFHGGDTFSGTTLTANNSGTNGSPIIYRSYGTGKAIIAHSNGQGFNATDFEYLEVTNLIFDGVNNAVNTDFGVYCTNTTSTAKHHIYLTDLEVKNFGLGCVRVFGQKSTGTGTDYDDVKVIRGSFHDCIWEGIGIDATYGNSARNTNIYVGGDANNRLLIYNIPGSSTTFSTFGIAANGIRLSRDNIALVEYVTVHDLGTVFGQFNAGISSFQSHDCTFQYNEVYNIHADTVDGDGLDFDADAVNCVMQYNYVHDCDGAGLFLCNCPGTDWRDNTVRFNITKNNAVKFPDYGEIGLNGSLALGAVNIFQNSCYGTGASGSVVHISDDAVNGAVRFRNNIFQAAGGRKILDVGTGQNGLFFYGNDYYTADTFLIYFDGSSYNSFTAWRSATSQESGPDAGLNVDPLFVDPTDGAVGFKLQSSSTLIGAGLDISGLVTTGSVDFFGVAYPQTAAHPNVGASEQTPVVPLTVSVGTAGLTVGAGKSVIVGTE